MLEGDVKKQQQEANNLAKATLKGPEQ